VYDIDNNTILNEYLLPGAIRNGTMDYFTWMKTRISRKVRIKFSA